MARSLIALILLSGSSIACGGGEASTRITTSSTPTLSAGCLEFAAQYSNSMPQAISCTPGPASCDLLRPTVSMLVDAAGTKSITGLCSCPGVVSSAHSASLDAALAAFTGAGCAVGDCPCPSNVPAVPAACGSSGNCE